VANSDSAQRDGSFDEFGEEDLGRSATSVTSSPMLGSGEWKGPGTPKEGRINWARIMKRKGRESLDVERSEAEMTGGED